MADMLALSGLLRRISSLESTADQMFWYRYFDLSASAVPFDKLVKALRVHLMVECGVHSMVDEARWSKMVAVAVGTLLLAALLCSALLLAAVWCGGGDSAQR